MAVGQPAARVGDKTTHPGGLISGPGCLTVLIGGEPAARVGDQQTCPMQTPGTPPISHVGGAILGPGSKTVVIGGQPAARVGDLTECKGSPPGAIAPPGCLSVLIGG